jgi:hypothetical protein
VKHGESSRAARGRRRRRGCANAQRRRGPGTADEPGSAPAPRLSPSATARPFPAATAYVAGSGTVPDPTAATLRQLARHTGLRIGTAVNTEALANDATYRRLVAEQFSSVTPENVMKWEVVEPTRGLLTSPPPTPS